MKRQNNNTFEDMMTKEVKIQKSTHEDGQRLLLRLAAFFLLAFCGVNGAWGQGAISGFPYTADFESSIAPFDNGDSYNTTNVGKVLRVYNKTAIAKFSTNYSPKATETVTISFTAYHGYLGSGDKTSSFFVKNSDGITLVGYTYTRTSSAGDITDVKLGGNTPTGFEAFSGINGYTSNNANGFSGNGKPYLATASYNPQVTMTIRGDGHVSFNFKVTNSSGTIDKTYTADLSGISIDLASLQIEDNTNNEDRCYGIDNLSIRSHQIIDYEDNVIDWTTGTSGRFTPVILEESGNHYLSVKQDERNNNGTTLTGNSFTKTLERPVPEGRDFNLTFDMKIGSSNNQTPVSFTIKDAANSGTIFSLTATGTSTTKWYVNSTSGNQYDMAGTNASQAIGDLTWYTVSISREGDKTLVTIKNKANGTAIVENLDVSNYDATSKTGGLGEMKFETKRYNANFAIDNIQVENIYEFADAVEMLYFVEENPEKVTRVKNSGYTQQAIHKNGSGRIVYTILSAETLSGTSVSISDDGLSAGTVGSGLYVSLEQEEASNDYSLSIEGTGKITVQAAVNELTENELTAQYTLTVNGIYFDKSFVSIPNGKDGGDAYDGQQIGTTGGKTYEIVNTGYGNGDLDFEKITINSSTGAIGGLVEASKGGAGGAVLIRATTDDNQVAEYVLTVAYTTEFDSGNGKTWNFNSTENAASRNGIALQIWDKNQDSSLGFPLLTTQDGDPKNNGEYYPAIVTAEKTFTYEEMEEFLPLVDNHDNEWTTGFKVHRPEIPGQHYARDPRWRYVNAINGDNAFVVPESSGLVFDTDAQRFYVRNDHEEKLNTTSSVWSHIGIRGIVPTSNHPVVDKYSSFTIPQLHKGDIVEINWKGELAGSGRTWKVTNLRDLRGKKYAENETFEPNGSQEFGSPAVQDRNAGLCSFIATGDPSDDTKPADVKFTLMDNGSCDIIRIRIYKGPYKTTMRTINLKDNTTAAPPTLLLDNNEKSIKYNYCNQLYSTNVGPAMYVIKGYEADKGFNVGKSAANEDMLDPDGYGEVSGESASDADRAIFGMISPEETARLKALRKNIVGLEMINDIWVSGGGVYYDDGVIKATSGYGKVTIRMNNYTTDLKYVVGYTNDYTLTIGSEPHQEYPHTWNFTNISGGTVEKAADNAYNSIKGDSQFADLAAINWTSSEKGIYTLNTANSGQYGSQYVPGATLVTINNDLGAKGNIDYKDKLQKTGSGNDENDNQAFDELNGLGFEGKVTIHTNTEAASARRNGTRAPETTVYDPLDPLVCEEDVTITIPDVHGSTQQDWIYVSATNEPTAVNATKVTTGNDGPDANEGNLVTKWKVTEDGNVKLTFPDGTKIYKIGVTHILKRIYEVGGIGWATESRRHSIDHTLTGYFTQNDVNAYEVAYDSYDLETATVELTAVPDGVAVPAKVGVVLKSDEAEYLVYANKEESLPRVPLFYPSNTTAEQSGLAFSETGNMMMANLDKRTDMKEQQNATTPDETTDGKDNNGVDDGTYNRFILTNINWTFKGSQNLESDESKKYNDYQEGSPAAGFYRLHEFTKKQGSADNHGKTSDADKNTMEANTAYMLVKTEDLPVAIWRTNTSASARRQGTIGIRNASAGTTGIEEISTATRLDGEETDDAPWYTISGQRIDTPKRPGLYINKGRVVNWKKNR